MNWNLGFFDADTVRRAAIAAGLGTGASALFPEDAEGARPKYMEELVNRIYLDDFSGGIDFGNISGKNLKKLQEIDPRFEEGPLLLSGKNIKKFVDKRINQDGLEPEELADGLNSVFHGTRAKAFANKKEGNSMLVRPDGDHAWKGVIAPHKDFSGLVTGYRYGIDDLQKELRASSGGRPTPPYPNIPTEGALPGRLTTVEENQKLGDNLSESRKKNNAFGLVGLPVGLGAGLTLSPEEAFGWGQGGLRTSELTPEDSAPLRTGELRPSDMGGNMTADLRLAGTPSSEGAASPFWREMARQFGLGTRGVLEGLGSGLMLGLADPGKGLSDLMGLPVPQTETEKDRVGLSSALAGVAGTSLLGAGLAKAPGAVLSGVGRAMSSDPVADAMLTLTDENFAKMLEYGNNLMDLLEQYEDDLWPD